MRTGPPSSSGVDAAECKRLHIVMKAAGKLLPGQDVILVATGVPRAPRLPERMSRALTARLRKLEASARDEERPAIFIGGDLTPDDKRLLFTDWRAAGAKGVANYSGGALY